MFVIGPECAIVPGSCRSSEGRTAGIIVSDNVRDVYAKSAKSRTELKDNESEGDEQVQKAMKGMLPPLLDGMPSRHKIAPEISLCPSTRSKFTQIRTSYSHSEQQIVKEISTAVAARGDVEIAVNSLRMELSVGSIESQPTGIPLLRIRTPNMQCFQAESRAAGCALIPK